MSKQTNKQPIDLHIVWRLLWSSLIAHSQPRESMDKQTDSLTDSWLIQQKTAFGSESKTSDIMSLNGKDVWCLWAHERWESYKPVRGLSLLFPSEVSGEKKGGDKGGEISFSAESNSFLQTFPLMEMRGVRPRRSKKKKRKKHSYCRWRREREKKPLSFFKYMQVMAMQRRAESKCGGRRGEGSDTNLCECEFIWKIHRVDGNMEYLSLMS